MEKEKKESANGKKRKKKVGFAGDRTGISSRVR